MKFDRALLKQVISYASQVISPPFCRGCSQPLTDYTVLCDVCTLRIQPCASEHLSYGVAMSPMTVFAVGAYEEPLRSLVMAKLWRDRSACYDAGALLAHYAQQMNNSYDVIVPVPLHWTRYLKRGYNQADILAHAVSRVTGVPVKHALVRSTKTAYQSTLSTAEREQNLKNAFRVKQPLDGVRILLVDDVMTTGATLKSAARALVQSAKNKKVPTSIDALVVCRVL